MLIDRGHKNRLYISTLPAKYNGRKISSVGSAVRFMVVCTWVNALEVRASGRSVFGWKNKLFQHK